MQATEILVKEHSLILQAVECLAQAREKLEVYEQLPQKFFESEKMVFEMCFLLGGG